MKAVKLLTKKGYPHRSNFVLSYFQHLWKPSNCLCGNLVKMNPRIVKLPRKTSHTKQHKTLQLGNFQTKSPPPPPSTLFINLIISWIYNFLDHIPTYLANYQQPFQLTSSCFTWTSLTIIEDLRIIFLDVVVRCAGSAVILCFHI